MPYTKIIYIKLFLELFDGDDRFLYQLNESQQLLFIKMLYLAGSTGNSIPKNDRYICNRINYGHQDAFQSDIKRIMDVFQGFKENENHYFFNNFPKLHNQLRHGVSNGYPLATLQKEKHKEEEHQYYYYVNTWNSCMPNRVQVLTPARKEHLAARMKEKMFTERYQELLDKIKSSPFLSGRRSSKDHPNWKADFDWIIKNPDNYAKILEGKYHSERDVIRERVGL